MSILVTALSDIGGRPLRTIATILGLVAAICAVIILDSASRLSQTANELFVSRTYGRSATFSISLAIPLEEQGRRIDSESTSKADAETFDQLRHALNGNGFDRVSLAIQPQFGIQDVSGNLVPVDVMVVSPTFPEVSYVDIDHGSFPLMTAGSNALHIVVSSDLAIRLGYFPEQIVGTELAGTFMGASDIASWRYPMSQVIVDAVGPTLGPIARQVDLLIVMDAESFSDLPVPPSTLLVAVASSDINFLQQTVGLFADPKSGAQVFAIDRVDNEATFASVLRQQRRTALIGSLIALFIGGLGVLSVGIANVRERTSEFGIRSALGATSRHIYACVLCQSVLEALLAGVTAIALSIAIVQYGARFLVIRSLPLPDSTTLPLQSAILGFGCAIAVGTLAALLPAYRASRISVSTAIRI